MNWFGWLTPFLDGCMDHLEGIGAFAGAVIVILGVVAFIRLIGDLKRV